MPQAATVTPLAAGHDLITLTHGAVAAAVEGVAMGAIDAEIRAGADFKAGAGIVRDGEFFESLRCAREQRRDDGRALS